MKQIVMLSAMCLTLALTSCTTADSAEVALVVDQIGNDKGIPNVQTESGLIFYFPPTQDVFTYPTSVQHVEWIAENGESIDVSTSDGATFGIDVAVNIQLIRPRAAELFVKYRVDMEDLIKTRVKALVRKDLVDNASSFAADSLLQYRTTYEAKASKTLEKVLAKEGFLLNNLTVAKLHLPTSYKAAIEKKIKVIQETARIKSETEQATQIALKKVATAKGNYEAAQYDAKTKEILSQPKMLELYRAETERTWANKGVSPYGHNNVFGSTSGMFLQR